MQYQNYQKTWEFFGANFQNQCSIPYTNVLFLLLNPLSSQLMLSKHSNKINRSPLVYKDCEVPYFLLLARSLKLVPPSNKRRTLEQNYFISAVLQLVPPLINAAPRKAALIRKRVVNQLLNYFLSFIIQGNFIIFTNSGSYVSSKKVNSSFRFFISRPNVSADLLFFEKAKNFAETTRTSRFHFPITWQNRRFCSSASRKKCNKIYFYIILKIIL